MVYSKTGNLELYNLELDIAEQNNLVTEHPEKVNELKMKYERWRSEMGEPIRPNNNKKKR